MNLIFFKNIKSVKLYLFTISIIFIQNCTDYKKEEKPTYTLAETIYVDRLEDNSYLLKLQKNTSYKIFIGDNISSIDWNKSYDLSQNNNELKIENPNKGKRLYFAAVNTIDTLYFSEREIDMENSVNFRDLGGIETKDGKHVKWGMIYRSGELDKLTEEDLDYMKELKIKTICDLRSNIEIEEKPDMYPKGVNWTHLPIGNLDKGNTKKMFKKLREADPLTFNGEKLMEDLSGDFFISSKDKFKTLFDNLLSDKTPLLFHCTAGKDRTGYSSALILFALGVNEKTIFDEYLLSNHFRYDSNEDMLKKATKFYGIDERILRPLMSVKESYLRKGIENIKSQYGSMQNYLEKGIGLDSISQVKLKEKFLY
ncbi:protein-tyrosine-phosphatase [Polaribacter sp. ALD11]|uniref:tyrosine-protein phosphatase n=1 Tax=Polaribacter sp. ALD11 TaxID=2058137 RepID=UPI000C3039E5|nr:tyrosine-protein phosphatase [Polaribacter sp. ALD11]AUC85496.1 protein-tyrosine-phosphatase [Polaribacter sp. ALD11]